MVIVHDHKPAIAVVVAVSTNGVIGMRGQLPWHLPRDLEHFRQITTGHILIAGRATFESIGKPLSQRAMIVLTRQKNFVLPNDYHGYPYAIAHSLPAAISHAETMFPEYPSPLFVIGGAEVFREVLPYADILHYTHVHAECQGDTFMPKITWHEWQSISEYHYHTDARHAHSFTITTYRRSKSVGQ